jgi:vanillate O-demethylase monooxygenase subunit
MDNVPELHTTKLDKIMVKANYELVVDNLLDLSHTSYLHAGILGNADTVESEITVLPDGDDITVERHATNAEPPGMNKLMWPQSPPRVDKITSIRWMAPSTLRLITGICPIGEKAETGTGYHAIHILTPETDQTTHYFFTAVRYNVKTTDETLNREIQDKIGKMRRFAFEEQDAPVIEAQQRIIDASQTSVDPLTLAIDVGPVRYKKVLQKLIAAEQAS